MKLKTPRDIHSEETRLKILNTTEKLMSEYGVEALTVKNLCEAAGISNGTFFHYFSSKDTLISEYMQFMYDKYCLDSPIPEDDSDFVMNVIAPHIHNISFAKQLGVEFTRCYYNINNPSLHNRGNLHAESYSRYILAQVKKAQSAGYIYPQLNPEAISADVCMVAKGVIFEWGLCGDSFDVEAYLLKMLQIYLSTVVTDAYVRAFPETLNYSAQTDSTLLPSYRAFGT